MDVGTEMSTTNWKYLDVVCGTDGCAGSSSALVVAGRVHPLILSLFLLLSRTSPFILSLALAADSVSRFPSLVLSPLCFRLAVNPKL